MGTRPNARVRTTLMCSVIGALLFVCRTAVADDAAAHTAGFAALQDKRCADAEGLFTARLQVAPEDLDARHGRGLSRVCLGEYDTAVDDLQAVAAQWPDRPDVLLELGAALTSAGAYGEAEPWLRRVQGSPRFDGPASLLLGLCELRLGQLDSARTELERASRFPAVEIQARYYAGVVEYRAGHMKQARQHFTFVKDAQPTSAVGHEATAFLDAMAQRRYEQLRLFGGAGFEYDSNVILAPLQESLGGLGRQADGRAIVRLGGSWTAVQTEHVRVNADYSLFQSLHFNLTDFDLQAHELQLGVEGLAAGWRFALAVPYRYFLRTDRFKPFEHEWALRPSVSHRLGAYGDAEVHYGFRRRNFLDPEFTDLDGNTQSAGLRYTLPVGAQRSVAIGYEYEQVDLIPVASSTGNANQYSYDGHSGFGEADARLPWLVDASLVYAYSDRRYSSGSRSAPDGSVRDDGQHNLSLTLRRGLAPHLELLVGGLAIFNESNHDLYTYQRYVGVAALSFFY